MFLSSILDLCVGEPMKSTIVACALDPNANCVVNVRPNVLTQERCLNQCQAINLINKDRNKRCVIFIWTKHEEVAYTTLVMLHFRNEFDG